MSLVYGAIETEMMKERFSKLLLGEDMPLAARLAQLAQRTEHDGGKDRFLYTRV